MATHLNPGHTDEMCGLRDFSQTVRSGQHTIAAFQHIGTFSPSRPENFTQALHSCADLLHRSFRPSQAIVDNQRIPLSDCATYNGRAPLEASGILSDHKILE